MRAADFPYEVGDRVVVSFSCGKYEDKEVGVIRAINDGPVVESVDVEFEAGDLGEYAPEQIIGRP